MGEESPVVAIIEVGSNTIKLLVAGPGPNIQTLDWAALETRISKGIGEAEPRLSEAGIEAAMKSIEELLCRARTYNPVKTVVAATSAVRDAVNGNDFMARVNDQTGLPVRLLSGEEEARYTCMGVTLDPALQGCETFYLLDLGGGSLELLNYANGLVRQETSLPLGAVRLTENFVYNVEASLDDEAREVIADAVKIAVAFSGFVFADQTCPLIVTGGTMTCARLLLADQPWETAAETSPDISIKGLRDLFLEIAQMTLKRRCRIPLLPKERADIFPTGLLILLTVAELAGRDSLIHSFYNLRYGLAVELLAELGLQGTEKLR